MTVPLPLGGRLSYFSEADVRKAIFVTARVGLVKVIFGPKMAKNQEKMKKKRTNLIFLLIFPSVYDIIKR